MALPDRRAGGLLEVVSVLHWKLRIAVLWIFVATCQTAGMFLLLFEPGVIRDLMAGEVMGVDVRSGGVQVTTALYWIGPLAMAYLSLVLRDTANRVANGALGAMTASSGISALVAQDGKASGGTVFVLVVGSLVALAIIWHAWKWPSPDHETPLRRREETAPR